MGINVQNPPVFSPFFEGGRGGGIINITKFYLCTTSTMLSCMHANLFPELEAIKVIYSVADSSWMHFFFANSI